MHTLFIYGTLKRGFPNFSPAMNDARYLGTAKTQLTFPLVIGGKWFSPCLIDEPGVGHQVVGELFDVNDTDLKKLDQLEAIHLSNGYRRIKVSVSKSGEDTTQEVWTYAKHRAVIEGIHSDPFEEYNLDPRYIPLSKRPI